MNVEGPGEKNVASEVDQRSSSEMLGSRCSQESMEVSSLSRRKATDMVQVTMDISLLKSVLTSHSVIIFAFHSHLSPSNIGH
jgi:hypothetical protein